ncbi:uncharacterized protein LOC133723047 [Rosa rugosa]|uniref:uncharacterized protein LOC133723047 n=1 Tax=Rosa rugosa TaxID=74645 RepID=UPI002B41763B|nr:uncharacterized protein LOC133723047 [Rosa rugosa]
MPMAVFRSTVADCDLIDMGFAGSRFTWSNKFTKERLDRGFQTPQWRALLPHSRVVTLNPSEFDHSPLLIMQSWAKPSTGSALQQVVTKTKETSHELMKWYRAEFDNQRVELRTIQEKLNDLMRLPYYVEQYEEPRTLHVKHSQILAQQEKYRRQRSRALWLKDGDRNSAYFHRRATNRRSKNLIRGLNDEQNHWQTEPKEIQRLLLSYFSQVFSTESCNGEALAQVIAATPVKVTPDMNKDLLQPYTEYEIKQALFQMHPSKSPGPDGRIISDNTLVANEAAHFMHKLRHQEASFFSLKLDISKAYDRLEWPYLQAILEKLGFHPTWINMIMSNVKSVTYSILQQGEPTPPIFPSRGIRQVDPLSPYLFILCAEGLSALITRAAQTNQITGLQMCPQAPTLHHLFFADDSLLFGTATMDECVAFKQILWTYEKASGQKVNFQKSSVVFSRNVDMELQQNLASILAVQREEEHDKYLGLPLRVGKSKIANFEYIKERLSKKLISWKAKVLSCAGKEILIKAIAQTMPLYAMNCYLLPKSLCDDIHQLCASFFWGDTDEKKKIHWRSWEKLCLTKQEGAGCTRQDTFHIAPFGRQNLETHHLSLGEALYKEDKVLKAGIQWKIGDGTQVDIWNDKWIPLSAPTPIVRPSNTTFNKVADLIDASSRQWKSTLVYSLFPNHIAERILCIPLGRNPSPDRLIWSPEKKGYYSVKSAYWIARMDVMQNVLVSPSAGDPYKELWKHIWNARVPGKVSICVWRACNNLIATRDRLVTKGYTGEVHCLLCPHGIEDVYHLFCTCPIASTILAAPPFNLQNDRSSGCSLKDWLLEKALTLSGEVFAKLMIVLWALWKNRNNLLWQGTQQTAQDLLLSSLSWLEEFQKARAPTSQKLKQPRCFWKPPVYGSLKLNVDASFLPNQTTGGVGGVLRNDTGQVLAAFAGPIMHAASPKQSELYAIRAGLDLVNTLRTCTRSYYRK